jgi:type IV pilus assembly protein PilY1
MGRGIFVVSPTTGDVIWSASPSCPSPSTATCLQVSSMKWAVASDITFIDRDNDGKTDKFYFADLGGNVWRADVSDASTSNWSVTRVAALGCDDGNDPNPSCSNGKSPRKFFFPPSVLSIKAPGVTGSYDALSISSGDREHPLKSTATASSYNVIDRFFLIKDTGTNIGTPVTTNVRLSNLVAVTSNNTLYDGTGNGFYITFATGEKAVNAPLAVGGSIFFSTNRPIDRSATCAANLGEAKAYAVNPFDGFKVTNVLSGGGLPPSPVAGLVNIVSTSVVNGQTVTKTTVEKFCIGCGISGTALNGSQPGGGGDNGSSGSSSAPCTSALENCNASKTIAKKLKRTYWYKK